MPHCRASAAWRTPGDAFSRGAAASSALRDRARPRCAPRCFARVIPKRRRSRMSDRSNSANALITFSSSVASAVSSPVKESCSFTNLTRTLLAVSRRTIERRSSRLRVRRPIECTRTVSPSRGKPIIRSSSRRFPSLREICPRRCGRWSRHRAGERRAGRACSRASDSLSSYLPRPPGSVRSNSES